MFLRWSEADLEGYAFCFSLVLLLFVLFILPNANNWIELKV